MGNDGSPAILHIEASDRDSDLLWRSGFWAGDPFVFVEVDGNTHLLLSDLELGRGKKESKVDEVHSWTRLEGVVKEAEGIERVAYEAVIDRFLRDRGVTHLRVPSRFPLRIADRLRDRGFQIETGAGPFYAARTCKTAEEIGHLEAIQAVTEDAMLFAIDQIHQSEVRNGDLFLEGQPLDVPRMKRLIRIFCLERGAQLGEFIVAPGDQGCDPHEFGSGALRAGETIIIDIFPRDLETRFWGDMTRTVLKGSASEELLRLHATVREAQEDAIAAIAPGVTGDAVHARAKNVIDEAGYKTELKGGDWVGFFHGTGHGVGLDIHEPPRLAVRGPVLEKGMAVTVEPGLYYPGLGGCRIEDVVIVTENGGRNLNRAPKILEVE
jgi:Xaa-Pro aminopeptidase